MRRARHITRGVALVQLLAGLVPAMLHGDMVFISGGTNSGTDPDFGAYSLTVSSFYMDRYPVTKALWDEVYNWAIANGYSFDNTGSGKGTNHPVHSVNWYDAVKWCNARSEMVGRPPVYTVNGSVYITGQHTNVEQTSAAGYRLPLVIEWEYAARGGLIGQRFPWGANINHAHANYNAHGGVFDYDTSPYTTWSFHPAYNDGTMPYTSPVGSFAPNGYGLYDMSGNVWEWCFTASNPQHRFMCGGAWSEYPSLCRVGFRVLRQHQVAYWNMGFRTVLPSVSQVVSEDDDSWLDAVANELCSKSGMGSPVFVKSGNYRQTVTDAVLPGRGLPLQITRTYNSKDAYDGPFSRGWNFNQTIQLIRTAAEGTNGTETAVVRWANGVRKPFTLKDGVYEPPLGCYDTLAQNAEGYLFTTPGGMTLQFNNGGFLLWQEDRVGNRVTYSLDLQNRISRATTSDGRTLDYAYDPELNRVNCITDWTGREWNYQYATNDTLVKVVFPDGSCNTLEYDEQNRLIAVCDAFSNLVHSAAHDTNSQYTTAYGEGPVEYTMGYDAAQNVTTKRDNQDRSWSFRYNEHGNKENLINPAGIQVQMQWTPQQKLSAQIDPLGNAQHYEYDERGNVLSVSNALGHVTRYTYETNFNQVTSITDPLGNVVSNRYDAHGNLIWSEDARGFVTEFHYDSFGQLTNAVDAHNNATVMTYNPHGELLNVTDTLGNSVSYTYDDRGNRLTMTDARGATWQYGYDIMDRLVAVTNPVGQASSYTYDMNGNRTSVTDARSNTTLFAYDEYNRLASVSNAFGYVTAYEYDVYGNPLVVRDALGNSSSNAYNILNRLVETTDPLGHVTSFSYDENGNRTAVTDPLTNITSYAFDPLNRMVAMTNGVGGVWEYAYDANHNLLAVTDAREKTSENQYDARSMVTNSANAMGHAYRYTHDGNGNVIERTDPNGATLVYSYDDANRLTNIAYPNGTALVFSHDESGNVTVLSNATETVLYAYDPLNRVTNVFVVGLNKTVGYEYDAVGNRAAMIDPDGGRTTYEYDSLNRLVLLSDPGSNMWTFAYDAINRMTNMLMPNGIRAAYAYDAGSRLTDLVYRNSSNAVLQSFAYTYDAVGNPVSVKREDNQYELYQYDKTYQLTRVDYDATNAVDASTNWTEYVYDLVGNRLTLSDQDRTETYLYDDANRLLSVTSEQSVVTFGWDDNGNMTNKAENGTNTWYAWDYENKLVHITYHDGSTNAFSYYPSSSLRHTKVDSSGTNQFVYDGQNLLQELDGLGTLVAQYQYSLGIDSLLARTAGGNQQYYLRDMIGSVTAVADENESLIATYRYDVFGTVRRETGDANNPYLFTSRRLDQDSGLYYYRARYMDARRGRFVSLDPAREGNGFGYVGGRPTMYVDPDGRVGTHALAAGVGVVWGLGGSLVLYTGQLAGVWDAQQREEIAFMMMGADAIALAVDPSLHGAAFFAGSTAGGVAADFFVGIGYGLGEVSYQTGRELRRWYDGIPERQQQYEDFVKLFPPSLQDDMKVPMVMDGMGNTIWFLNCAE